jgi:hypothetical protein
LSQNSSKVSDARQLFATALALVICASATLSRVGGGSGQSRSTQDRPWRDG